MQVVDSRLQSLATLYSDYHYQGSTEQLSTTQNSQLFILERSGNPGRPRFEIRQEQIHGLREALGFRWVDIARMLGMSPRTLVGGGKNLVCHSVNSIIFPPCPTQTWTIL